jgi:hypothetical protein
MERDPPAEVITPNVAAFDIFVPGAPKFGVFVTPTRFGADLQPQPLANRE